MSRINLPQTNVNVRLSNISALCLAEVYKKSIDIIVAGKSTIGYYLH